MEKRDLVRGGEVWAGAILKIRDFRACPNSPVYETTDHLELNLTRHMHVLIFIIFFTNHRFNRKSQKMASPPLPSHSHTYHYMHIHFLCEELAFQEVFHVEACET